ncbi:MAG: serine protease [Chloroflexi bacterium RBG_16_57_8]|nr:MAG: serine protease [Chloroflexi bacterium RBG_16_57_8]
MKRPILTFLAILVVAGMIGCSLPGATAETIKSDKPRDTSPTISPADQDRLVEGNTAFALDLYRLLAKEGGNIFFSPYSISEALAMTYAGARGQTEADTAGALFFTLPQDGLHPAFNWLDLELAKRGEGAKGKEGEGFRLHVVNAIWGQKDYQFLSPFLDTLATNYGAGLRLVDYINETEKARVAINKWVEEQTEEKIKDLVPEGALNSLTRLVLTNAIYFNAAWMLPFDDENTADGVFHRVGGSEVTVPMMKQTASLRYAEGDNYQAVEMPYDGGELSMIIILPDNGQFGDFQFADFTRSMDAALLRKITNDLRTRSVTLTMPEFEFDSAFGLKDTLSDLGMAVAFADDADFSAMSGQRDLHIQDVVHKAFISVDEAGTEAAAATAVIVGTVSLPEPAEMTIDSPFIFAIRDNATSSLIFLGQVVDPGQ